MTPEREQILAELLQEVVEKDKKWIPDAAYPWIQKLVCWAAVEVMIVRKKRHGLGLEVLLRKRKNDPLGLNGWHIIGGYIKPGETVQKACTRHACDDAGVRGVKNLCLIGGQQWTDHPLGFPYSSLIVCEPVGRVQERDNLKFFDDIPDSPMIHENHKAYLGVLFGIYALDPKRQGAMLG